MAASEAQRIAYLEVMGVQPYFPRRPLPGAKPVQRYAEGLLRKSSASVIEKSPVAASAQDVLSMLVAKPQGSSAKAQPPAASPPQQAPQAPVTRPSPPPTIAPATTKSVASKPEPDATAREDLRFVFAYFPINEHCAVVNELPWSSAAAVTTSCRKLLADILKALGVDVPERNLNPMVFTWPLFEGAPADLNSENARQTLEGFIAKRLRLLPVKTLLVFAEQSAQYLFPVGFLDEHESRFKHPRHEVEVIVTHSLNAMEAVPELKRTVWKTLQPLRGQLAGSVGGE